MSVSNDRWRLALWLPDTSFWTDANRCAGMQRSMLPTRASINADSEPVVRIIDRLSDGVIVVYWADATACRYTDQLWKLAVARQSGRCALSAAPIDAGDVVYRPRAGRERPVNAAARMLASEVERVWSIMELQT